MLGVRSGGSSFSTATERLRQGLWFPRSRDTDPDEADVRRVEEGRANEVGVPAPSFTLVRENDTRRPDDDDEEQGDGETDHMLNSRDPIAEHRRMTRLLQESGFL